MDGLISLRPLDQLPEKPGSAGQWVHLLTLGINKARDNRTFIVSDPHAVVRASLAHRTEIAVDYEHQTELSEKNGKPAPAAGWIKQFSIRASGIWALVEWTEKAKQMLSAREYRFISPTINVDAERTVRLIAGAGLTNRPALVLTALAKEKTMTDLDRIAEVLNLSAGSTVDDILGAIKALQIVDLKEHVPADQVRQMLATFTQERAKDQELRATLAVDSAMASGKIAPVLRDWALTYCLKDQAGFESMVAKMPVLMPLGEEKAFSQEQLRSASSVATTQADDAVARQLGLDPKVMR